MRPDEVIQNERKATETMSETSEGTMTTSVSGKSGFESRQELFDIAAVLGIGNPDDLLQERFRVDRRKLEQMLLGEWSESFDFWPFFFFSLFFLLIRYASLRFSKATYRAI